MEHEMRLQPRPYRMIRDGEKTIELRLYDEKRRLLRVGDSIRFTNTETGDELTARVAAIHVFPSFEALYRMLPLKKCGYTEEEAASARDMEEYYSAEDVARCGAVGIKLVGVSESPRSSLCDGSEETVCGIFE